MNASLLDRDLGREPDRDVYERFDPFADTLFFKTGARGVICFHGPNFNIRKRLTADERSRLLSSPIFVRVSSNCYINVKKVSDFDDAHVYFAGSGKSPDAKRVAVSGRTLQLIRRKLQS
jgi:hypothetical protein